MEKFSKILQDKYLFHIHTDYTDAKLSCRDYFEFAYENDIKTLIFTEHVRKILKYDFFAFVKEIDMISKKYPTVNYKIGVEAKILPNGGLDIPDEILNNIEIICFACHGFPIDVELYYKSFINLFNDEKWSSFIRVWVHPGRFLKKHKILDENIEILKELLQNAIKNNILIEYNIYEELPPKEIIIPDKCYIKGYDIHERDQLKKFDQNEKNK